LRVAVAFVVERFERDGRRDLINLIDLLTTFFAKNDRTFRARTRHVLSTRGMWLFLRAKRLRLFMRGKARRFGWRLFWRG